MAIYALPPGLLDGARLSPIRLVQPCRLVVEVEGDGAHHRMDATCHFVPRAEWRPWFSPLRVGLRPAAVGLLFPRREGARRRLDRVATRALMLGLLGNGRGRRARPPATRGTPASSRFHSGASPTPEAAP